MTEKLSGYFFDSECTNVTLNVKIITVIDYVYPIILPIFHYLWFSVQLSITIMHGNGIHYVQHIQAVLEHGVGELAHSFFLSKCYGGGVGDCFTSTRQIKLYTFAIPYILYIYSLRMQLDWVFQYWNIFDICNFSVQFVSVSNHYVHFVFVSDQHM